MTPERSPNPPSPPRELAGETGRALCAAVILLVAVISLWGPFGVEASPQGDGWILKNRVANGRFLFAHEPTRALLSLPWVIAHTITPASFVGVHLVFIGVLWAKGLVLFAIVRRLPGAHDGIALLVSALFIVYPASTWTVALDAPLDRHWALLLFLVSILCLIRVPQGPPPLWMGLSWAAIAASLWTNEAILPLALAVPGLIWWVHRGSSRARTLSLLWIPIPILNALHNLVHHVGFATHASWVHGASRGVSILATEDGIGAILRSIVVAYRKHFADCWIHAAETGTADWPSGSFVFTLVATVVVGSVLLWTEPLRDGRRPWTFLLAAGLVLLGLGFAPFAPTSMRFTDGRAFIVSSLGATLAAAGALLFLAGRRRYSPVVAIAGMGVLIGLGTIRLLDQRASYDRGARSQDALLGSIVEQAPRLRQGTVIVIVFDAPAGRVRRNAGFWPRDMVVENALRYLYDDQSIRTFLVFGHRASRNRLTPRGLVSGARHGVGPRVWDYGRVIAFDAGTSGRASLIRSLATRVKGRAARAYDPATLILPDAPPPPRAASALRNKRLGTPSDGGRSSQADNGWPANGSASRTVHGALGGGSGPSASLELVTELGDVELLGLGQPPAGLLVDPEQRRTTRLERRPENVAPAGLGSAGDDEGDRHPGAVIGHLDGANVDVDGEPVVGIHHRLRVASESLVASAPLVAVRP